MRRTLLASVLVGVLLIACTTPPVFETAMASVRADQAAARGEVAELLEGIAELRAEIAERDDGEPVLARHEVEIREGRIVELAQAVREREARLADLERTLAELQARATENQVLPWAEGGLTALEYVALLLAGGLGTEGIRRVRRRVTRRIDDNAERAGRAANG